MSIAMKADDLQELHIVEWIDEQGPYCLVYTDETNEGMETQYDNLEAAAGAIVAGEMKRGEHYRFTVHGDDAEVLRFNNALLSARREWERMQRIAAAPRCKKTGRPLFVRMS